MKKCFLGALYVISALLSSVFAFVFREKVSFHIAPVIVLLSLLLQFVILFAKDSVEVTNLSSGDLNKKEVFSLMRIISYTTLCAIPLIFPLVVFGKEAANAIIACTIWLLTFAVGFVIFRISYGSRIKNRIKNEEIELQEQKKREEQGLI